MSSIKPTNKAQSFASYVQQTKNNTFENKGMALASKLEENKEQERLALKRKLEEKREAEARAEMDQYFLNQSFQRINRISEEIEYTKNQTALMLEQMDYNLYKAEKEAFGKSWKDDASIAMFGEERGEQLNYAKWKNEKFWKRVDRLEDAIINDPLFSKKNLDDGTQILEAVDAHINKIIGDATHRYDVGRKYGLSAEEYDLKMRGASAFISKYDTLPFRVQDFPTPLAMAYAGEYLTAPEVIIPDRLKERMRGDAEDFIRKRQIERDSIKSDNTKDYTQPPIISDNQLLAANFNIINNEYKISREDIKINRLGHTLDTPFVQELVRSNKNRDFSSLEKHFEEEAEYLTSRVMGANSYVEINNNVFSRDEMKAYLYRQVAEASHYNLLESSPEYYKYVFEQQTGKSYENAMRDRVEELKSIITEMKNEAGNEAYWDTKQKEYARGKEMGHLDFVASFVAERIADGAEVVAEEPYDDILEKITAWEENDFSSGFSEAFDWSSFFSLGIIDLANSSSINNALEKHYNGKNLSAQEKRLVKLHEITQELESYRDQIYDGQNMWSQIGSGIGSTVDMAPSFLLAMTGVGSIGAGVKFSSKAAVKTYIKYKTFKTGAKMAGTLLGDATKLTVVSYARGFPAAVAMPSTYTNYLKDVNSQYSFDENGELVFKPKDKTKMFLGAVIDNANEIASEFVGGTFGDVISLGSKAFGRAAGISKALNKSKAGTWLRKTSQAPISNSMKKFIRNAGYSGIISEPLSEVYGDFISQVMRKGVGAEYDFEHFKDPDYWITTMGVSTIYGGALTTLGAGKNIVKEANYAKKLVKTNNELLGNISNEDLKNTLKLLGNSENFINSAIELSKYDWKGKGISPADKARAIKYMRNSYALQVTMGDIEGQRHMHTFGAVMYELHSREYIQDGKSSEKLVYAIDKKGNIYNILEGNYEDENSKVKVKNNKGEVTEISNSELIHLKEESIGDSMAREYHNMFSIENESFRLNAVRQTFEEISNPTKEDVKRVISEFGIEKLEVGDNVTLVDGTEATIQEDLKNGKYKIERYNPETTKFEKVEIPVYDILSDNPITAKAQKKMYEDAKNGIENDDPSAVQEVYKSPKDKIDDIINGDYDFKLFDAEGNVQLSHEEIVTTFNKEDPNILGDYINKIGNKVSPQVKQSLNDALELSKKHNEIVNQISHAVQNNKVITDVAKLTNVLSKAMDIATPSMSVEEILESIINNEKDYSFKIRKDFKKILKDINSSKVQEKSTIKTKTKTSVTQKDVKGKRGRKQIEKGIKDLRNALKDDKPIEVLNAINWIDETLSKVEDKPITTREKQFVEETRKTLKEQGYEIHSMRGMYYHEGVKANVQFRLNPELPADAQIIKEVSKPQINKDGVMVQAAEIVVEQGPEIGEETPNISQVVTKEMTGEEPIDFSEPTDNTVEPKKEDSIPQDTTEQEFTIPELERIFAVPDSDKLIETPSREEEVETLTDEQRSQVRIHNENGTDLIDHISDSALPDDPSTDEIIVDKHELQGNRIYRYNGEQLRNNQAQVRRTSNKEGDNHDLVYKWLDENSIDLQGIIDNELAAIAALDTDVKFMMMTGGTKSGYTVGSSMLNTVFQVVEYTDAIKRIHNEKRGGIITSNGKEYLLIGITGFSTPKPGIFNPEAAHYNFIADKILKPARNNYTSQTDEISRDAYYVHPTMSTKIKNIEAGWIVTQTTEDSEKQSRSLGELLADETRNPHGITAENSKWLIPTRNSAKPIKVRVDANDIVHGLKIPTGLAGSLFLLVPAANGHYIPVSVKIQTTNELTDGTLKDTIWEVAQNLLSTEKETRDYTIRELCKLLNLTKEGYNIFVDDSDIDFDNPNSAKIVFTQNGRRMATEIPLNASNASAELYNTIFSNIPFQLNIGLQTLVSGELQAYIDAGALITDAALLGTTNASYTVHSIGPDLKADPYTENSTESQEGSYENSDLRRTQDTGIINYGNNSYSVVAEGQYRNTVTGELVTIAKIIREIETHIWLERYKPIPSKIEQDSKAKLYILGVDEVISVSKNGIITFYSAERSIEIIDEINRENIEESRINNAVEELARIEEQQQAEQVIPQELQEEKNASVPEVTFTENFDVFNTPEVSPVEDSFTEVSFEETSNPKEEVSATFTEGVVENTDASQLYTDGYLGNIEEQLIAEGMSEEDINAFMDKVIIQLKEYGMDTYYTKDQESKIKAIVDNIKNCH